MFKVFARARSLSRALVGGAAALVIAAGLRFTGASQWVVDDDGPADFSSIQAAVVAVYVASGDSILVKPGTYPGIVYLGNKDLAIRSEAGPFMTILDAQEGGSVVSFYNRSAATRLEGFTVTGGRDQSGGGIWIYGGAPVITRNIIRGNRAVGGYMGYGYGGGIEIYSSAAVITRNVIRGNTALDGGGGIDVYYAGPSTPGTCCPLISQNTIVGNTVTGAGGMGGGVLSFASSPRITSSIVAGNQAPSGGGIFVYKPQNVNDAPDATGGIFFANAPGDADSNRTWHLHASNRHIDPRLGPGTWIDLWPRSDSPALEQAESAAPAAPDLTGLSGPADSDLDGLAKADIGAVESRGEITSLSVMHGPGGSQSALLAWDDSVNPGVVFNVYAQTGAPFVTNGGTCLAPALTGTQVVDSSTLTTGQVRFYLVTGRGAEEGSRGLHSDGTARPSSPSCPLP